MVQPGGRLLQHLSERYRRDVWQGSKNNTYRLWWQHPAPTFDALPKVHLSHAMPRHNLRRCRQASPWTIRGNPPCRNDRRYRQMGFRHRYRGKDRYRFFHQTHEPMDRRYKYELQAAVRWPFRPALDNQYSQFRWTFFYLNSININRLLLLFAAVFPVINRGG